MIEDQNNESIHDDYDSPWKEALDAWFPEFMTLFFPVIHQEIDWGIPPRFMDKELQQVVRDAKLGRRYADKLIQVWTLEGKKTWVLIHVEVQGQSEPDFNERMYVYNYRLFDRYQVDVISLAILTDPSPNFRAGEYRCGRWGCDVQFRFPTVKLLDLGHDWETLEASDNPFTLVVMAHLMAQKNRDGKKRLDAKLQLIRLMYHRGYNKKRILTLFRVIDWLLHLPPELVPQFQRELSIIEEKKMPYITSIERLGLEKGIEQGMQQGEATVLNRQLQRKFGEGFTDVHRQRVKEADSDILLDWSEQVLYAQSIDEVFYSSKSSRSEH
uniref:DUF4351 domain-containing protein n=2 Tax=Candidatus Kentrum sp. MB TaxID=2138164 RepID=A0A451BFC2_9GAMM|nr:MAG: hypothetical protein BECKMB1821H_GA0114242_10882 [Candidatus Kentron sp. MB]